MQFLETQWREGDVSEPGKQKIGIIGGGLMGHPLAHENEAPYPLSLCEFFVKSFCPPNGIVLDPFGGAGATGLVADRLGRTAVLIDLNSDYCRMADKRIADDRAKRLLTHQQL